MAPAATFLLCCSRGRLAGELSTRLVEHLLARPHGNPQKPSNLYGRDVAACCCGIGSIAGEGEITLPSLGNRDCKGGLIGHHASFPLGTFGGTLYRVNII